MRASALSVFELGGVHQQLFYSIFNMISLFSRELRVRERKLFRMEMDHGDEGGGSGSGRVVRTAL